MAARHDLARISALTDKIYPVQGAYSLDELNGQLKSFPEGQFVAEHADQVIGYCASMCLPEKRVFAPHTWEDITANGYGATHDPDGDYLYGYEVCVDPDFRNSHVAKQLYRARFALCADLDLKGIVCGGRLPGLRTHLVNVGTVHAYLAKVIRRERHDPVLTFQLNNGFEVLGLLADYMPEDVASMGYATHLLWRNPNYHRRD